MIATRVKLAHGGVDLNYEMTSKRSLYIVVLLSLAAVARASAHAAVDGILINTSLGLFTGALLLWSHKFFKIENTRIKE
jgi:hypothetical protein